MGLKWSSKTVSEIGRLYEFLAAVDKGAAVRTVRMLTVTPTKLLANARIGEKVEEFSPREVRRFLIGHYEMRYEIRSNRMYVLRVWHTRENR